jgi:hypothetical protein
VCARQLRTSEARTSGDGAGIASYHRAGPKSFEGGVVHHNALQRVVGANALLMKAIHTAKAIRHLCDGGFSGDAHPLGRVLLENAVIMAWVIRGPATVRLDTFCLEDTPRKNRWLDIVEQYYADHPELAAKIEPIKDADADTISRALFKDAHTTWPIFENENGKLAPVTVKDMFFGTSDKPQDSCPYQKLHRHF